ncbi:MAG: helix-turn-helix domain-containing protein [Eubacteriales bacterium]
MKDNLLMIIYIQRCRLLYTRMVSGAGKQWGLSQTACDVLIFLHNNPQFNTAKDVVTYRMIAKSNVSTAVEELKKAGYLVATPDPQSRRSYLLQLTQEATPVTETVAKAQDDFCKIIDGNMTETERETLYRILKNSDKNIENALKQKEN